MKMDFGVPKRFRKYMKALPYTQAIKNLNRPKTIDKMRFIMQARLESILEMREDGFTLEAIGKHHDLTRERVRQILAKHEREKRRAESQAWDWADQRRHGL